MRDSLGVGPQDGGVLVSRLLSGGSAEGVLEVGDVLLSVDGTRIDSDGTFTHPTAGRILLFALFTEGHRPGDAVSLQLVRKGQRLTTKVVLKARPDDTTRVPWFQSSPRAFTIQGGLVFERLTREYLMTLGRDWESSAPTRLLEPYELDRWDSTPQRDGIVVLTRALPVPSTLGYEHVRNLTVDRINDVPVRSLDDVRAAFGRPKGGFHVVTFNPGQDVTRLVLDADEARKADASVREKYHLENEIGPAAR